MHPCYSSEQNALTALRKGQQTLLSQLHLYSHMKCRGMIRRSIWKSRDIQELYLLVDLFLQTKRKLQMYIEYWELSGMSFHPLYSKGAARALQQNQ